MTKTSEEIYPETGGSPALATASRKAAAAGQRRPWTAGEAVEIYEYWRCLRETAGRLSMLDDAGLREIGLQRGDIMQAARRAALAKHQAATRPA